METSSTASLIGCWADTEDYGNGDENYPAGQGAEEEEEEPGDAPIVEEEDKAEEEGPNQTELLIGGWKEEEEFEEEEKPPCTVEDLLSEDMDDGSPPGVAVEAEPQAASTMEMRIGEEASDKPNHNDPDDPNDPDRLNNPDDPNDPDERDPDDLSDCLQVEMAIVSSDSDADDQWRASANTGEGEKLGDGVRDDVVSPPTSPAPLACQPQTSSPQGSSPTLIPEDEQGAGATRRPSADPERRVPQDYCVLQKNRSENVDPEHLDFLGVRQQWRQMELEVKGHAGVIPQPSGVSCHLGSHGSLYAPVRSGAERSACREEPAGGGGLHLSTFSPGSEDSGVDELSGRSPYEELENPVEREIRLTMEREESFRRERSQAPARPRPSGLPPRPQGDDRRRVSPGGSRTPTFSISPSSLSPSPSRPVFHEMSASNVIILEPDTAFPLSPQRQQRPHGPPLLSPGPSPSRFSDWPPSDTPSVIILETSNLIIRSASEFCLSSAAGAAGGGGETVLESTFSSNPFFKLRSRSSMSLVEQEIRAVKQREEEWRRQRAQLQIGGATRERYDTVLVSPNLLEGFSYERTEMPVRCVSSPSSPTRTRKMDRSTLSCDHRFFR